MRSVYDNIEAKTSIEPTSRKSTNATVQYGNIIDTKGYNSGMIVLRRTCPGAAGVAYTAVTTASLEEGDESDGSDMAAALDNTDTQIAASVSTTSVATTGKARIEGLGINRKRYLRIKESSTFTGSTAPAITVHAEILLGRAYNNPVETTSSNT